MKEESLPTPLLPDERLDEVNEQIKLIQKRQGLTFGTDAYLLSAFIRPQPRARAVDLGSGTGILPLLLCARNKIASATAVEVQPVFAELISRNAAINRLSHRITPLCIDLRELTQERLGGDTELVFSNPPYMKPNTGRTNAAAEKELARHEICGGIRDFTAAASRILRTKGRFVCVFRPERLCELFAAMQESRIEPKRMVTVHPDVQAPPCLVLVEGVKDAAPSLKVSPPLFLYEPCRAGEKSRRLTPQASEIYRTCSFPLCGKQGI